ncbi:MAG: O-acetyl-ADP-ribose deacetylase [Acidimicrobiales bacterium]|jgi:O-acetyl-ADP-ribose deacetylase (regulator of RNase III)
MRGAVPPPTIRAVLADITTLQVDAVVNAANSALVGGGGVDGAIHRAAGSDALSAACAVLGGCDPGDAKATPGFRLPARFIVHTVGPVWRGGDHGEADVLASCYRRSMEVAEQIGITSIAFPAISTGSFGFPVELAAQIAVGTLRSLETSVQQILLVAIDRRVLQSYETALAG